jgi:hypothetical protein
MLNVDQKVRKLRRMTVGEAVFGLPADSPRAAALTFLTMTTRPSFRALH